MKIKIPLFLIFLLCSSIAKSQVFDTCIVKYKYIFTYQVDSLNTDKKQSDLMILEIGNKTALYYSKAARVGDSIQQKDIQNGFSPQEIAANKGKYNLSKSRTVIIKNYPENKMTVTDKVMQDYKYIEPLAAQEWKIVKDTATIYGVKCQKATANFRGRNYEAWFTKSIPVIAGPWKFYGLPGLILNVYDIKHQFSFEFNGIEIPQKNELMEIVPKQYILASRKEVWNLKKEMFQHPYEFAANTLNAMGIKEVTTDGQPTRPLRNIKDTSLPFNPMELE
ncbi:GLPGLI family protein [Ferruginibacter sp. SUN106]|uniref:GLPGLI family protein n=1 Tax=Ferruginibacter sp. SUN106 TaxID=2978348 RepID=UPI003D35A5D3